MAEHSFRSRFCWCSSARAQGLQNKCAVIRAILFYSTDTRTICALFLYYWTQCIDGFSLLLQRYVRKGNDAKIPAILSFFFVTERTQLNAVHAQLLEKLRPIAFAETCRFLTIQSLEFQEIWQKNSSETTWMIYGKKSEFWHRKFLTMQKTIYGELRKSPMSKFYKNSVERRDLASIRSVQMMKKI